MHVAAVDLLKPSVGWGDIALRLLAAVLLTAVIAARDDVRAVDLA